MDQYADRRGKSFRQAEGLASLPTQLNLGELDDRARVRLHLVVMQSLTGSKRTRPGFSSKFDVGGYWASAMHDLLLLHYDNYLDQYSRKLEDVISWWDGLIKTASYADVLDALQYVLEHKHVPTNLRERVNWALESSMAAYRVLEDGLIVPVASPEEGQAARKTFELLSKSDAGGARMHLAQAAKDLSQGEWASSVRESISAVESVAKVLAPNSKELKPALQKLEKAGHVHTALREGFLRLYGYTSDQPGIRHPLLGEAEAKVDEADALYMFGACSAFITYLLTKARNLHLLDEPQG